MANALAAAGGMVSQDQAQYLPHPKGLERCELCTMFRAPHRCTYVAGNISPRGWCKYFDRKSR